MTFCLDPEVEDDVGTFEEPFSPSDFSKDGQLQRPNLREMGRKRVAKVGHGKAGTMRGLDLGFHSQFLKGAFKA